MTVVRERALDDGGNEVGRNPHLREPRRQPEPSRHALDRGTDLASRSGSSLNTWLVNLVRAATSREGAINVDIDLSSIPFLGGPSDPSGKRRMSGWV